MNEQNWKSRGIIQGLLAGGLMTLFLFAVVNINFESAAGAKFLKYIILIPILGIAIYQIYKVERVNNFKIGIKAGALLTLVAAVVTAIGNFVIYTVMPTDSISKFGKEVGNVSELMVINGAMLFEIFVFGMLITFIWLQYFKRKSAA